MEYRRLTVTGAPPYRAVRNLSLKGLIKNGLSNKLVKHAIKFIGRAPTLVYKSDC